MLGKEGEKEVFRGRRWTTVVGRGGGTVIGAGGTVVGEGGMVVRGGRNGREGLVIGCPKASGYSGIVSGGQWGAATWPGNGNGGVVGEAGEVNRLKLLNSLNSVPVWKSVTGVGALLTNQVKVKVGFTLGSKKNMKSTNTIARF